MKAALFALAFLAGIDAAQAQESDAPDRAAGLLSFNKCLPCHAVGASARNKVGPVLNGLDGRRAGTFANYSYSDANRSSGLKWDEASFSNYIKDPRALIPGTKMIFAGIKNEREIRNLWAYLSEFAPDGSKK